MGGASAGDVSARFGMSAHTIYSRMKGRGKKARRTEDASTDAAGEAGVLEALIAVIALGLFRMFGVLPPAGRAALEKIIAQWIALTGARVETQELRKGGKRTRRHHSEAIWKAARRDYEEGDFTAPEIADRYGMTVHAVKKR